MLSVEAWEASDLSRQPLKARQKTATTSSARREESIVFSTEPPEQEVLLQRVGLSGFSRPRISPEISDSTRGRQ